MERLAIELHDSQLAAVRIEPNQIVVELRPAYVHKSTGEAGTDAGVGGWQDFDVILYDGEVLAAPSQFPQWIYGGSLSISTEIWKNVIPIPLRRMDSVLFRCELANDLAFSIQGRGISVVAKGDANFSETFP